MVIASPLSKSSRLASPGSVVPAYEQIGAEDKQLRIFGGDRGDDYEFGHGDILLGDHAREVVFPEIIEWLESHASESGDHS